MKIPSNKEQKFCFKMYKKQGITYVKILLYIDKSTNTGK